MRRLAALLVVSAVLGIAGAVGQSPTAEPITVIVDPQGDQDGAPVNGAYDLARVTWSEEQGMFTVVMGRNAVYTDPRHPMGPSADGFRLHFTVDGQAFQLTPTAIATSLPPLYEFRLDRQALGGNGSVLLLDLWAESLRDDPLAGMVQEDRAPDAGFGDDVSWMAEPDGSRGPNMTSGSERKDVEHEATTTEPPGRRVPHPAFLAVLALAVAVSRRGR